MIIVFPLWQKVITSNYSYQKYEHVLWQKKWKDNAKFFAHERFISFWEVYNFQTFLANNLIVDYKFTFAKGKIIYWILS